MSREPFNPYLIRPPDDAASVPKGPLTVSQVTALVKDALAAALPATLHVVGEISNFKRHSSGHLYFTLKDAFSELSCVMWRSTAERLKFDPADGLAVIATGGVEVFERAGRYQLYVRKLEPRGVGALELAFRQLCEKLEREGLFDPARKKPLPVHPRRVVIITSPTGAAIADMIRTMQRRYPCLHVLIYPVRVQGPEAAGEIARAIARVNACADALGGVDVLIIGRGGGSLEDLWAFNEEVVARAVFASRIPVVSAVGHEVDVTIADLVADVRAATPTAAAELVAPLLDDVVAEVERFASRLGRVVEARLRLGRAQLAAVGQRRVFREPLLFIHHREQTVDEWAGRLAAALEQRTRRYVLRIHQAVRRIQQIAPHAYLLRATSRVERACGKLISAMMRRLNATHRALSHVSERLDGVSPARRLPVLTERVDALDARLRGTVHHRLTLLNERLGAQHRRLYAVSHERVLARGYSVTRRKKGNMLVRSTHDVRDGDRLVTQVTDGAFESTVVNRTQRELFD